jgi:hypothetical protein
LGQSLIAFGQGAGTMPASAEAVEAIIEDYLPNDDQVASWPDDVLVVLEYARSAGRIAASRAASAGRGCINARDWDRVKRVLPSKPSWFERPCPWTPRQFRGTPR